MYGCYGNVFIAVMRRKKREEATLSGLMKSDFVSEVEGKPTALYVLKNKNGGQRLVLQTTVDAWFL